MKHSLLKLYIDSSKTIMMNKFSLKVYHLLPNILREWATYCLYHLLFFRIPKIKFLIFAQGRTGSTLFVDLLNSHPDVFSFGEIMDGSVIKGVKSPVKYAEGLMTLSNATNAGFKVKVYQLERHQNLCPAKTLELFEKKGWKIIYLRRNNLFEHAISDLYSENTGHYHNINTGNNEVPAQKPLLHISYEEIVKVIKVRERYRENEVEALKNVNLLDIEYERDLCDAKSQAKSMNRVFSFLGVAPYTVSTSFKKVVSKDFGEVIEDYASIKQKLKNSEYGKYLN